MRIIDLSTGLNTKNKAPTKVKIKRVNHRKGAKLLALEAIIAEGQFLKTVKNLFNYLFGIKKLKVSNFPNHEGLAWETVTSMTHRGTHLDAPYHFGSVINGKKAKTIEDIPLNWCYNDGFLLDFSYKKPTELIYKNEIIDQLKKIKYTIKPLDIAIIKTGCSKYINSKRYLIEYPGLDVEALVFLINQGVKIIGVDSYSLDRPSFVMVNDFFKNNKDSNYLWPTHFAGRNMEYCHIEQLCNLDNLPGSHGFKISCFPVVVEKGSAGWCRVVAMINN